MFRDKTEDIERRFVCSVFHDPEVMEMLERCGIGSAIVSGGFLVGSLDLMAEMKGRGDPLDWKTFCHQAMKADFWDKDAFAELISSTETSAYALTDLKMLMDDYKKRETTRQAMVLQRITEDGEWEDNVEEVKATLNALNDLEMGQRPKGQRERAQEALRSRQDIIEGKADSNAVAIETGIDCIDRYCRPLSTATGDFNCLLFAATSTGKSSLMAQMVSHNVFRNLKVAVFLGETNYRGLVEQMAGQISKVSIDEYDFRNEPLDRQRAYMETLEDVVSHCGRNLFIYDDDFSIEGVVSRCRKLEEEHGGLDFVVIDHMHCLKARRKFTDERLKYNYISGELKPLGIEMNCPILCLAQPSRSLKTSERPPMLSDLKESGNLEDDADRVWALWMPSKDSSGMDQERKDPNPEIKLFQLKYRRGRVTDVTLRLQKRYTLFTDNE